MDDVIVNPGFNRWAHVRCVRAVLGLPGPGSGGQEDADDLASEDGMVGLRPGTDEEQNRREAVTLHKRYPNAIYLPVTPDPQELKAVDRPKKSHQPWKDDDDDVLRRSVERGYSAFAIGITMDRSTTAILARIRKVFGDESEEVKRYGTWEQPGDLAGHQRNDWNKLRIAPSGQRHSRDSLFSPYEDEYCGCGEMH